MLKIKSKTVKANLLNSYIYAKSFLIFHFAAEYKEINFKRLQVMFKFFLIICVIVLGTMDRFPIQIILYFKNKKSNVMSLHFKLFEYTFYFNICI